MQYRKTRKEEKKIKSWGFPHLITARDEEIIISFKLFSYSLF